MPQYLIDKTPGPFRAEQLRDGDPYELSNGHPIYCMPGGEEHAGTNLIGANAISTDPDVEWAGVDAGYAPEPGMLRAPDVAVGTPSHTKGWIKGVPALAVEYAGIGQNEQELQDKIQDLLRAGTKLIWVVRLKEGPRRVEIYAPGVPKRVARVNEELTAPGILRNPIPVLAMYDRQAAKAVMLRNLLQTQGYPSLDAVRLEGQAIGKAEGVAEGIVKGKAEGVAEGIVKGKAEGVAEGIVKGKAEGIIKGKIDGEAYVLKRLIIHRFGNLPEWAQRRIDTADAILLETWAESIFDATSVEQLLGNYYHGEN